MLCAAGLPCKELHLPGERDPGAATMLRKDLGQSRDRRLTGPVALQLALHCHPGHRHRARLDHATHCHFVSLDRDATRGVGDNVDLIALAQCLDRRHGQANLGPEGSHNHLLSPGLFNRVDDATILPGVDEGPIDRLLLREDVLQPLDQETAAFFQNCGQDGRYTKHLRCLGQANNVIHDHRRFVTVQVGKLEWLMVDQQKNAILGCEKRLKSCLAHGCFLLWLDYSFFSSHGLRIRTRTGMTTQVSRMTMPTAMNRACSAGGCLPMSGFSSHGTSMLTGQTPRTVTMAIFQRGGDAGAPGGANQYSRPLSRW